MFLKSAVSEPLTKIVYNIMISFSSYERKNMVTKDLVKVSVYITFN